MPYTKSMINQDQMQSILSDYAKQYSAMMARSAANVAAFHEGRPAPFPAPEVQSTNWHISDRH